MGNIQLEMSLGNMVSQTKKPRQAANNSGNDEWYTPPAIIDLVRQAFGGTIDLDPASCDYPQTWIQANTYYTIQTDGLAQDWKADNVFMNPPYGSGITDKWIYKFIDEWKAGHFDEAIILVNTNNCTKWYEDLVPHCTLLCLKGSPRISFIDSRTQQPATQPAAHNSFFYFKKDGNTTQFKKVFGSVGNILKPQ